LEYKDYYAILGVDRKADQKQIKEAYRKLARQYHPDRNKDPGTAARFKEICEAYEVLGNPEKRAKYDAIPRDWHQVFGANWADGYRHAGPWWQSHNGGQGIRFTFGSRGAEGFSDFFRMFFASADDLFADYGYRTRETPYRGHDLEGTLEITLREAYQGTEKAIRFNGRTLQLRIPPGTGDGSRIKVPQKGAPGTGGGPAGDLYVRIRIRPHHFFRLNGRDLECTLPVTVSEAALGARVEFPFFKGTVSVNVPPGSQNGTVLRLKGLGLPAAGGEPAGDLLVRLEVKIPEKPTPREKELLKELQTVSGFNPRSGLVI
jgi:curved DNA-binding protein